MKKNILVIFFVVLVITAFNSACASPYRFWIKNQLTGELIDINIYNWSCTNEGPYHIFETDGTFPKGVFSGESIHVKIQQEEYFQLCSWGVSINGGEEEVMEMGNHNGNPDENDLSRTWEFAYKIPYNLPLENCNVQIIIHFFQQIHNEKCEGYQHATYVYRLNIMATNGRRFSLIDVGDHWEIIGPPIGILPTGSIMKASLYNQYGNLKTTATSNTGTMEISKAGLRRGLYILKGECDGIPFTEKLTVAR